MFEFDPEKSSANFAKHGIDFGTAQALWDDEKSIAGLSDHPSELRHLLIGMLAEKYWTAVFTHRDASIRIISVRRARAKEVWAYEHQEHD